MADSSSPVPVVAPRNGRGDHGDAPVRAMNAFAQALAWGCVRILIGLLAAGILLSSAAVSG